MEGRDNSRTPRIRWAYERRYYILFGVSYLSLSILVLWWAVNLKMTEDRRYEYRYTYLELQARFTAALLGHKETIEVSPEYLSTMENLEMAPCEQSTGRGVQPILPFHPELCIGPQQEVVAEIERAHRSRNLMVLGEGALSVMLLVITGWMFYRLTDAEKRSARELQELWSRVTHELKTPITGLKALLQTLETQELTKEELDPLVKLALQEVERQEHLAENLLMGQDLVHKFRRLKLRAIPLSQFVLSYFSGTRLGLDPRQLDLSGLDHPDVVIQADPNGLRIILDNLVDNAAKYCGPSLRLSVSLAVDTARVRLTLEDNGPGFRPDLAETLFEAYRRLSDELPRGKQGTGMGLFISRKLARDMGGDLTATSRGEGAGAAFTLTFPLDLGG